MATATIAGGRTPGSFFSSTTDNNSQITENLNAVNSITDQVTIKSTSTNGSSFANIANEKASDYVEDSLNLINTQKDSIETLYNNTVSAKDAAVAAKEVAQSLLTGLTDIPFNLGTISQGNILYYDGESISPLEQIEVTDGGNF